MSDRVAAFKFTSMQVVRVADNGTKADRVLEVTMTMKYNYSNFDGTGVDVDLLVEGVQFQIPAADTTDSLGLTYSDVISAAYVVGNQLLWAHYKDVLSTPWPGQGNTGHSAAGNLMIDHSSPPSYDDWSYGVTISSVITQTTVTPAPVALVTTRSVPTIS